MPFAHNELEAVRARLGHPVPISPIATAGSWKLLTCFLAGTQLGVLVSRPIIQLNIWIFQLNLTLLSRLLPISPALAQAIIQIPGSAVSFSGRLAIHYVNLLRSPSNFVARFFWLIYFFWGNHLTFHDDYTEAWRQKFAADQQDLPPTGQECSLYIFTNNGDRTEVPCRWDGNDKQLLETISAFFYLRKARRGLMELLSLKSLQNIEVVKLEGNNAVGEHRYLLMLGRYRTSTQYTYYFRNPSLKEGDDVLSRLKNDGVVIVMGQQTMALNFVSSFDSGSASLVVLLPIVTSFLLSVFWPIVAVTRYQADVQTSVQTGFTVGSYVVTTGALIIALIAFLDTRYSTHKSP
ncbi:hypothetical protein BDW74DRAFT_4635 [Aspergillus multicolor]|uniref:uncharacterized protein n=1 Tax=Aspergillus multicolor TaxID=41759 RepID=UPI003CCE245E